MKDDRRQTLITGASSGIGRELARALCRQNHRVTGVARRADRLQSLADELQGFEPLPADLTRPGERERVVEAFLQRNGPPDYLVLNAGLAHYGKPHLISQEQIDEQIELNFTAVLDLTRRFLPALLEAGSGRIIVISSVLGVGAIPFSSIYSATKHAVNGFVRGLRMDLRGTGVSVSVVCPSSVRTEFRDGATASSSAGRRGQEPVERVVAGVVRKLDCDRFLIYPTLMSAVRGYFLRYGGGFIDWALSSGMRDRFAADLPRSRTEG
jgi:short-subunit dehydrogenase